MQLLTLVGSISEDHRKPSAFFSGKLELEMRGVLIGILCDWQNLRATAFHCLLLLSWGHINSPGRCLVIGFIEAQSCAPSAAVAFTKWTFVHAAVFMALVSLSAQRCVICGISFLPICNSLMKNHAIFIFSGSVHRSSGSRVAVNKTE